MAKVTRPFLSGIETTKTGELHVVRKQDEALVVDRQKKAVARFAKKGGLYIAVMRVHDPRRMPFPRQAKQ